MSSGFFLKSDGTHMGVPVRDSYVSERTGRRADLLADSDYPVTAECQWCHGRIRLSELQQMEWRHLAADATPGTS